MVGWRLLVKSTTTKRSFSFTLAMRALKGTTRARGGGVVVGGGVAAG
jgi:hypothetical protein